MIELVFLIPATGRVGIVRGEDNKIAWTRRYCLFEASLTMTRIIEARIRVASRGEKPIPPAVRGRSHSVAGELASA